MFKDMAPKELTINELPWPEDRTGTDKALKIKQFLKMAYFGVRYGKGYMRPDKAIYTATEQRLRELGHQRLVATGRLWALPPDFKDAMDMQTGPGFNRTESAYWARLFSHTGYADHSVEVDFEAAERSLMTQQKVGRVERTMSQLQSEMPSYLEGRARYLGYDMPEDPFTPPEQYPGNA